MARWYPKLTYDPWAEVELQDEDDIKVYARTWIGVVSEDGVSFIESLDVFSTTVYNIIYARIGPHYKRDANVARVLLSCHGLPATVQRTTSEFARPHARRLNREIIHQRLETVIQATVSPQSILVRIQRHRLYDRNVFISVMPLYLRV